MMQRFACCGLLLALCQAAALGAGQPAPTANRAQAAPEYVGEAVCAGCHEATSAQFRYSVHARLKEFERRGHADQCEACHGAGSKHAESADPQLITRFSPQLAIRSRGKVIRATADAASNRTCLACHGENHAAEWPGSEHAMSGLSCADCHVIHQARRANMGMEKTLLGLKPRQAQAPPPRASLRAAEPDLCYGCHREKRAQMNYTSHHPVREGRMACSSCHAVHGSAGEKLLRTSGQRVNELCYGCHTSKQGPFLFEHAVDHEGCGACHEPHGTVANNLLRQNEPFLCLQCHEAHFHIGRSGISTALNLPTGASANPFGESGWRAAFATKCTQCHTQIHGTDLPSQSLSGRGKALTR